MFKLRKQKRNKKNEKFHAKNIWCQAVEPESCLGQSVSKTIHLGKRPEKKNSKCKLFPKEGGGGNPKVYIF